MRIPQCLISFAMVVTLAAGLATLAQGQQRNDTLQVQARIDRSVRLQREALENLNDPARAEELVRQAYRELSAAQSAMIINASGMRFPDPLLDLNNRKASEALLHLQRAEDTLTSNRKAPSGDPYIDGVRRNLERALRLTRLVLVL